MGAVEENIQLASSEAMHTDDRAEMIQQLKEIFALTKSWSEIIVQYCQRVGELVKRLVSPLTWQV